MFLAIRDLRRGARRFALLGAVIALVAVLLTLEHRILAQDPTLEIAVTRVAAEDVEHALAKRVKVRSGQRRLARRDLGRAGAAHG